LSVGKRSKNVKKTKEKKLKMFINPNSKKQSLNQSKDPSMCTFGGADKENEEQDKFEISCITLNGLQSSEDIEPSNETIDSALVKGDL
jgi:hypothetical protein